MTTRSLLFILLSILIAGAARADEITLKSGRVISGKITSETEKSFTIKLGSNMFLSVAKDEISGVVREKAPESGRQTMTLEQAMASTSTVAGSTPTAKPSHPAAHPASSRPATSRPAAAHSSAPKPAGVKPTATKSTVAKPPMTKPANAKPDAESPVAHPEPAKKTPAKINVDKTGTRTESAAISTDTLKIGVARIARTILYTTYQVDGKDFASARAAVLDEASGKGFIDGHKRNPSKTEWDATWSGVAGPGAKQWKEVIVFATVTVTVPAWKSIAQAPAAEAEKWTAFLKEASDHEGGHLAIIHDALMSFGESASNLSDPGEKELNSDTVALFKAIQEQAAKRRQGYDRRGSHPIAPIKKKP